IGLLLPTRGVAQQTVERRVAVNRDAGVKIFVPTGSIRLIGWDRDSLVVTGTIALGQHFFFGVAPDGGKFGLEESGDSLGRVHASAASHLDVYLPMHGSASLKAVTADVDATGVSGWFYTVSGHIRLRGRARTVEAEAMDGDIDIAITAPWVRARTGSGALVLRGRVEDASASSISGPVTITTAGITRGRFGSVTGNVTFASTLGTGGIFEFDNHSGTIDLRLPLTATGSFQLTTVKGTIDNRLVALRPASISGGRGQALAFRIGSGGAHVTVRTFKGPIKLRHQ
ncbi:MAG: DUF4097 family beta strand repeat-containing protein, partial [Gemmatimonadaceae bacterium]